MFGRLAGLVADNVKLRKMESKILLNVSQYEQLREFLTSKTVNYENEIRPKKYPCTAVWVEYDEIYITFYYH
jgi:hypothetical protein